MSNSITNFNKNNLGDFLRTFDNFPYWPTFPNLENDYELFQEGENLVLKIKTPGFAKENLKINIDKGVLSVTGEISEQKEDSNDKKYYKQMSSSYFTKSIKLPNEVDEENIQATLDNGLLKLVFKIINKQSGKNINIT